MGHERSGQRVRSRCLAGPSARAVRYLLVADLFPERLPLPVARSPPGVAMSARPRGRIPPGPGGQAGRRRGRSGTRLVGGWPVAEVRDAEITIVGGGAVGCAVAYVLARAGYPDIQVVERGELAGATSGQAAGLVGQVRATRERCRLAMASAATYSRIEKETGHTADWRQTGSVRIAMTSDRAAEFRALGAVARSAGLEVEFLTPARLAELCPVLDTTRAT